MAVKGIDSIKFIDTLRFLEKKFFSTADLEKITGLERESLKVVLHRLVRQGVLSRLRRGVYELVVDPANIRVVANQLYYPSYVSFETALSDYGILSQIPYTVTFATTKKSKKITIRDSEVEYTQLRNDLFFGYTLNNGIYIAEPEKALLDQLYLVSRGKRSVNIKELETKPISKTKLAKYAKKYPETTGHLVDEVLALS